MTWRTQRGERTLKGAEAALIQEALGSVADMIEDELEELGDQWEFGVGQFDQLPASTRFALLAEVGWALLRDTESCPKLTAINEATVAVLFLRIEESIQFEVECGADMKQPSYWRSRVLAVFHEDDEWDELPAQDCCDLDEWESLVETLTDWILWDADYSSADTFLDAPPETASFMRQMMTIDENYYRAIPPDPRDSDLPRIRAVLAELCPI